MRIPGKVAVPSIIGMLLLLLVSSVLAQEAEIPTIVYFTTQVQSDLQNSTEAMIIEDHDELEKLERIDALILDDSSITLIDQKWLTEQINNGAVIAFINTSVDDAAELMENPCLINEDFEANEYSYIIASQHRVGANADEVERVWAAEIKSCSEDDETDTPTTQRGRIKGFVSTGYGLTFEDHGTPDDFSRSLNSAVRQMQRTKAWALNQGKP